MEGDSTSCFDTISPDWLQPHIPLDKAILQTWRKAGFREKTVLEPTEAGTPHGGVCSPVLAHRTLDGRERQLREHYPKARARSRKATVNVGRDADDFLSTGSARALLENDVKPLVAQCMRARGRELSQEQTSITPVKNGFDFLGHTGRKDKGTVRVKPSQKNGTAFVHKVRKVIKGQAQATAGNLRRPLHPRMRGWAHSHQHVSSKPTVVKVDNALLRALGQWATRRHPKKPTRGVQAQSFHHIEGQNGLFCGEGKGQQGKPYRVQ